MDVTHVFILGNNKHLDWLVCMSIIMHVYTAKFWTGKYGILPANHLPGFCTGLTDLLRNLT